MLTEGAVRTVGTGLVTAADPAVEDGKPVALTIPKTPQDPELVGLGNTGLHMCTSLGTRAKLFGEPNSRKKEDVSLMRTEGWGRGNRRNYCIVAQSRTHQLPG